MEEFNDAYNPREEDTPRTKQKKEVRKKRLEYYSGLPGSAVSSATSEEPPIRKSTAQKYSLTTTPTISNVRKEMLKDSRVKSNSTLKPKPEIAIKGKAVPNVVPYRNGQNAFADSSDLTVERTVHRLGNDTQGNNRPSLYSSSYSGSNSNKDLAPKESPAVVSSTSYGKRNEMVQAVPSKSKDANGNSFESAYGNAYKPDVIPAARKSVNSPRKTSVSSDTTPPKPATVKGKSPRKISDTFIDMNKIDENLQQRVDTSRLFNKSVDTELSMEDMRPQAGIYVPRSSVEQSEMCAESSHERVDTSNPVSSPTQFIRMQTEKSYSAGEQNVTDQIPVSDSFVPEENGAKEAETIEEVQANRASLDYKNLYAILGRDKMDRLLHNLQDSEWVSTGDTPRTTDSHVNIWESLESREGSKVNASFSHENGHELKRSEVNGYYSQSFDDGAPGLSQHKMNEHEEFRDVSSKELVLAIEDTDVDFDLESELKTHRPEGEEPVDEIFVGDSSRVKDGAAVSEIDMGGESLMSRNYTQLAAEDVKCAFSAEQIYAEAEQLSTDEEETSRMDKQQVQKGSPKQQPLTRLPHIPPKPQATASPREIRKQSNVAQTPPVKKPPSVALPLPAVSTKSFNNPSLERYFSSVENFAAIEHSPSFPSNTFEPVPEPDIEETPRGDDLKLVGKPVTSTVKSSYQTSAVSVLKDPEDSRLPYRSTKDLQKSSDNLSVNSTSDESSDEEMPKYEPPKKPESKVQSKQTNQNRSEEIGKLKHEFGMDNSIDNEDLYTRISTILSTSESQHLTERLKKLGIDLNFLREDAKKAVDVDKSLNVAQLGNGVIGANDGVQVENKCGKCGHNLDGIKGSVKCQNCSKAKFSNSFPIAPKVCESPRQMAGKDVNPNKGTKQSRDTSLSTNSTLVSEKPMRQSSLPKHLQEELSLNLRGSQDSTTKNGDKKDMTSSISIDYSEDSGNSPTKSLSRDLQNELSLNLQDSVESSVKSWTGAKSKKSAVNGAKNYVDARQKAVGSVQNGKYKMEKNVEKNNVEIIDDILESASVDGGESPAVVGAEYQEFVSRLIADPRFKAAEGNSNGSRPKSAEKKPQIEPQTSKGAGPSKGRPRSAGFSRGSTETPPRKWATSSVAWGGGDVSKSTSVQRSLHLNRPSSAKSVLSHARAILGHSTDTKRGMEGLQAQSVSFTQASESRPLKANRQSAPANPYAKHIALAKGFTGKLYDHKEESEFMVSRGEAAKQASILSPRISCGELSMLLCLPDEILLYILSYLTQGDRGRCRRTSHHLNRVASDDSLWRSIVVNGPINDFSLCEIGRRQPSSLSFRNSQGQQVTTQGLRQLFQQCGPGLEELTVTSCSGGQLTGEHVLLHASTRCPALTHLDISWTNADDCGLAAVTENCSSLQSLCVNGCQQITDDSIHSAVVKHGESLRTLELFGCFNISSTVIETISIYCKHLVTLNLGQCWKISDTSINLLAASLTRVENLDLRGCKQMKDSSVHHIVSHCHALQTLALSNCPGLTDTSLAEIATYLPTLRSLDVCGCKSLTNTGVRSLVMGCSGLLYLDISSTQCDHKSVSMISSYCNQNLQVLKVNYCKKVSVACLIKLTRNAPRLRKLFLYGIPGIRAHHILELRHQNPQLIVETDTTKVL